MRPEGIWGMNDKEEPRLPDPLDLIGGEGWDTDEGRPLPPPKEAAE